MKKKICLILSLILIMSNLLVIFPEAKNPKAKQYVIEIFCDDVMSKYKNKELKGINEYMYNHRNIIYNEILNNKEVYGYEILVKKYPNKNLYYEFQGEIWKGDTPKTFKIKSNNIDKGFMEFNNGKEYKFIEFYPTGYKIQHVCSGEVDEDDDRFDYIQVRTVERKTKIIKKRYKKHGKWKIKKIKKKVWVKSKWKCNRVYLPITKNEYDSIRNCIITQPTEFPY